MTLEPGMLIPGSDELMLVHEEDIVVTEDGAEWLSDRAPIKMTSILDGNAVEAKQVYEKFEDKSM